MLWEADEPDHVEDISGFEDRKLHALLAHRSQFRSTMHIDESDQHDSRAVEDFGTRMKERHAKAGAPAGLDAGEAFKIMSDL